MKRNAALVSLSRDHHRALSIARKLCRSTIETAAGDRAAALIFWEGAGRAHFRIEEEVLLPAYAAHGDGRHPLVGRALCDHVVIRQRMDHLARASDGSAAELHELGALLSDHVRLEERQLFVLIESAVPAAQLEALAVALRHAHER
jgi:hypothetical protein